MCDQAIGLSDSFIAKLSLIKMLFDIWNSDGDKDESL